MEAQNQQNSSLMCSLFSHRDLKPENILLDDRGMFQCCCFFLIVQFKPEWANMWARFLAREYYLFFSFLM